MNLRASMLVAIAAGSLCAAPAWANRGGGHGHGWGWGPFGLLLGSALLYTAIQPRTYYPPPVVYAPPAYGSVAQPYYEQTYANPVPVPPPPVAQASTQSSAGGSQWWYFCRSAAAYYPYVRECPGGWEKMSPTPPGINRR